MRLPPQVPGEEAPQEELASRYRQPIQPPALADDRDHARRLVPDFDDPQLMPDAAPDRLSDPEHDDHPRGARPHRDPDRPGERVTDKRNPGDDLVGESEREPQVDVKMDDPPGLVSEPAPGEPDRGDPGHHQQAEAGDRRQQVRIGRDEHPQLAQHPDLRGPRIAERDQDHMGGYEAERPRRDPPVPADEPVLPDRGLQPRQAGDQHDHDQHQVRAGEASKPARSGQQPSRRGQRPAGFADNDGADYRAEPQAGQNGTPGNEPRPGRRTWPARPHGGRSRTGAIGMGYRLAYHQPIVTRRA